MASSTNDTLVPPWRKLSYVIADVRCGVTTQPDALDGWDIDEGYHRCPECVAADRKLGDKG